MLRGGRAIRRQPMYICKMDKMTGIKSYHMLNEEHEPKLCLLLQKIYKAKKRAVVFCADMESQESVNKKLWTFGQSAFIPHGISVNASCGERDQKENSLQPILLALEVERELMLGRETVVVFVKEQETAFLMKQINKLRELLVMVGAGDNSDGMGGPEDIVFFAGHTKVDDEVSIEAIRRKIEDFSETMSKRTDYSYDEIKHYAFKNEEWKLL